MTTGTRATGTNVADPVIVQRVRRYRTLSTPTGVARFIARQIKLAEKGRVDPKALQAQAYAAQVLLRALHQVQIEESDQRMKAIEAKLGELLVAREQLAKQAAREQAARDAEYLRLNGPQRSWTRPDVVITPESVAAAPEPAPESPPAAELAKQVQAELEADARTPEQPRDPGWLYRGDYRR